MESIRRPGYFLLLVAVLFCSLLISFDYGWRLLHAERISASNREVMAQANRLRALIESEASATAFLATGVESYIVARKGKLVADEIRDILELVYKRGRHFRNIGVAPDNRIAWVFPVAGNEAAVGLDYQTLSTQWPEIEQVIRRQKPQIAGPVDLVQGGRGLIYRSPIFIDGDYWGLLSTVIDADSLFSLLADDTDDLSPRLALRAVLEGEEPGPVFFGAPNGFDNTLEVLSIHLPGSEWQMAVKPPLNQASLATVYRWLGILAAFILSLLAGVSISVLVQRKLLMRLDAEVQDRTAELRQSHDLIASVLTAARAFAIIVTDEKGAILLFNRGAELMLGYTAEEVTGKHFVRRLLLPTEVRAYASSLSKQYGRELPWHEVIALLSGQSGRQGLVLHYRHCNGELVPVQVVVSERLDAEGKVSGYLAIAEDISERMRNENLKNQFVSTVSHELRTPLTAITGALGLIHSGAAGPLPEELQPMLSIALSNSQRLTRLVNDLLDIEKLMAGRMPLSMVPCQVAELVHGIVAELQNLASQKKVALYVIGVADVTIKADSTRFQQVLTNLISNAIKFSPPDSRVTISMTQSQHSVRIAVEDLGSGIPQSFRPFVFKRFAQADGSDNRLQPGTGLGLAISKELTEQMGGCIGFDSEEGRGSCFWLEFQPMDARSTVDA